MTRHVSRLRIWESPAVDDLILADMAAWARSSTAARAAFELARLGRATDRGQLLTEPERIQMALANTRQGPTATQRLRRPLN